MRRFFRRHLKGSGDNNVLSQAPTPASPISAQTASTPGSHVCTPLCEGIASLPPQYHESILSQLSQSLGVAPDKLTVENISMTNARVVPSETRDVVSELHERRDIEGNTEMARMPLALPTSYQYPPLPKGHARFLRLGGLGSHPLAYLESHPLSKPPRYIAISYCWDPTSARRGMFLDMKSFSISETVLEVLNQVQASQHATGSHDLLWIDQICINQDDQNEKLDQMYRMGEIYSKASKVFIWLGPTANQSDAALKNMERMLGEVVTLNQATATRADLPEDTAATINEDHGQYYGHLFMRPWFRRLWTVQEALLARKLVVMCGYQEVDFELLVELASQVLTYGSLDLIRFEGASEEDMNNAIIGIVNLNALRLGDASIEQMLEGLDIRRFRGLVAESRSRQVTMAPDRVHAIMGVAPHQVREYMASLQTVQPNQTMWQLYAQFAKCMLENDPEWYFLSSAPSRDKPIDLPSWAPNFNSKPPFASEFTPSCGFSAGISPHTSHLTNRTITATELTAQGFRLDTVSEIIPQTAFREDNQNMKHHDVYGDAAREWEQGCMRLCQKVHALGPDQFPRFHVDILLAQSAVEPAMEGGRALDAYHIFWMGCRLRDEAIRQIREEGFPLPDHVRGWPDAVERFADSAVRAWRKKLPLEEYGMLLQFTGTMKAMCSGRPYLSTSTGMLGLGCPGVEVGDVICILYGTTVPYVLRPRPDGAMTFVGDAYIHNAMDGEAITCAERGRDEIIRIR
ncbi:heterokaryon incompatibility protein-domain-containing protein [Chaetomium fimeti]|uniref:Heterokaryon incompatibility protein-domain-containing protein n=1 Tax=Chaetomium fimeti TaxID=1854472 RepID=A0AAE0HAZ8_9PEZI|nr:heterokaryon incompatibility protein-domain-containing protein [Chaetomium fimeti]